MSKKILLISGNFYPEPTGIGKYSGEMIDWLSINGFECTVITTFPYYPDWHIHKGYRFSRFWYKKEIRKLNQPGSNPITIIRCPHYIPSSPTGVKRLLSEFTISFFSYLALFFIFFSRKYDYVLTVAPPFELGLLGVLYKKIRGGIFIYHIQDLQIDAAEKLGMIKSKVILRFLFALEKYIVGNADYVSSISEGMIQKIKNKCDREILHFPNWVNTSAFFPIWDNKGLKQRHGFEYTDKIVLYSGAIGEKQGLESILTLAQQFHNNKSIKFIICGSGPYKKRLIDLKSDLDLKNVFFFPLQTYNEFNSFLNMADVHLVLQKANAADLVLPSKLSTILAIGGVAIVTANPGTSLYNIMKSCDMGFLIEPENEGDLWTAIQTALSEDNIEKRNSARTYAENNLVINEVLSKFTLKILDHTNKRVLITKKEIFIKEATNS